MGDSPCPGLSIASGRRSRELGVSDITPPEQTIAHLDLQLQQVVSKDNMKFQTALVALASVTAVTSKGFASANAVANATNGIANNGSVADGAGSVQNIGQDNLEDAILQLMLSMGICNFNLNSIQNLGANNELQLLLQLQQLSQLEAIGAINPVVVDQLIQQEIIAQNFNLNVIKRSIDVSVEQAARSRFRPFIAKRAGQC
ncbi:hypothetical protein GGR57DRAFT_518059 [Xylariaceae sp. FL1272]|nr:hypothetical protein GGR57DRAFT_518059 [Xylariaceae sp. FL1272]